MALAYGWRPRVGPMYLSRYGDFTSALVADQDWPDDLTASFVLYDIDDAVVTTWDAERAGPRFDWAETQATVLEALNDGVVTYRQFLGTLHYASGEIVDSSEPQQ